MTDINTDRSTPLSRSARSLFFTSANNLPGGGWIDRSRERENERERVERERRERRSEGIEVARKREIARESVYC